MRVQQRGECAWHHSRTTLLYLSTSAARESLTCSGHAHHRACFDWRADDPATLGGSFFVRGSPNKQVSPLATVIAAFVDYCAAGFLFFLVPPNHLRMAQNCLADSELGRLVRAPTGTTFASFL